MGICITVATFSWDQNMDGVTTISDFWLAFKSYFSLPGNLLIEFLNSSFFNGFFEITYQNCSGVLASAVSLLVWIFFVPWALK